MTENFKIRVYTTIARILNITLEEIKQEIKPETTLGDLGLDSLDIIELTMHLEKEFEIMIKDDSLVKFSMGINTIEQLLDEIWNIVKKNKI